MAAATPKQNAALPEGIFSLLDTDLYKLTMQCAVLQHYPDTDVTYHYTNRTPHLKLNRKAFEWIKIQIGKLQNITLTDPEEAFLHEKCPYLPPTYIAYLKKFRFFPDEQVDISFDGGDGPDDVGDLTLDVKGKWVETILYEIPLLVLVSEAFFKFVDTDWDYDGQTEKAYEKAKTLLENGAVFTEFGTRRRRSYHAQDLVMQGLSKAGGDFNDNEAYKGKFNASSNVHFCHRYNLNPVGTVAHEWFMGIAAEGNRYEDASELGLLKWTQTFGPGVLAIALTDTFGTEEFLRAFSKPCPVEGADGKSYAEIFSGIRQDSGDPEKYVRWIREFYDRAGVKGPKSVVFSDSLNVELVLKYKKYAEEYGLIPSFGIGTFLTNDFVHRSDDSKSTPLNIVIKLSSAMGHAAVKISDNIGKNTGDKAMVEEVKERLGYTESGNVVDEAKRWG
ncbi:nicotinate phosphoribosyltransferase [Orbilia oligospora]|nr:nicotinate phosphoribosyltransferase [Orbilia oligospora]KAF3245919.1 nicotinate phosphoribosyltransferase [Orbilia oligospora]